MTGITILNVPEVALEKILSFLSYDEIARNRLVCKQFNNICGGLLTKGFIQLEKKHAHIYKLVKALLPRRPSERRSNVVVSRYCEILQGMGTRIRMLNVTYMRYIEQHLICFVPGKVLDEINRLMGLIESRFHPPLNNNQLLEELRDLSSMAMEHFDEHVLPRMEKREEAMQYKHVVPSTSKPPDDEKTQRELKKIHKRNRVLKSQLIYVVTKTRRLSEKLNRQNLRLKKQSSIIKDQDAKLQVQATRLENHDMIISEMKKKFEELQNNFIEIKTKCELNPIQTMSCNSPITRPLLKDSSPESESTNITKNLRRMIQYETMRQRSSIMRRHGNLSILDNREIIKQRSPKPKIDDSRKRKYKSIVDVDTSILPYSLWYRQFMKNKPKKSELASKKDQNLISPQPNTSEEQKNSKKTEFVYKSIIKQRASRVFPLTCLDLERKRKSYTSADIPTKLSKNEANETLKTLDLMNKYLPSSEKSHRSEIEQRKRTISSNLPYFESTQVSMKRKRDE